MSLWTEVVSVAFCDGLVQPLQAEEHVQLFAEGSVVFSHCVFLCVNTWFDSLVEYEGEQIHHDSRSACSYKTNPTVDRHCWFASFSHQQVILPSALKIPFDQRTRSGSMFFPVVDPLYNSEWGISCLWPPFPLPGLVWLVCFGSFSSHDTRM